MKKKNTMRHSGQHTWRDRTRVERRDRSHTKRSDATHFTAHPRPHASGGRWGSGNTTHMPRNTLESLQKLKSTGNPQKSALLIKNHGGGKRAVLGTIYHSPPPLAQLVMCLAFSRTRPAGERGEREGRECETESQRGSERERERGVGCVRYTEITAHMTTRRAITSQRSSGTPNCRYAVPR